MFRRFAQSIAVCLFAILMIGADSSTTRLDKVGHQLVCQCGCGQILMECNHVGCPVSPVMISELRQQLDSGLSNRGALDFFINKYGPISLAAPIRGGFDNVAWIVPIAAVLLGVAFVFWILKRWKARTLRASPVAAAPLLTSATEARIRRDTDYDHWSTTP